jgi:hypothetical protein
MLNQRRIILSLLCLIASVSAFTIPQQGRPNAAADKFLAVSSSVNSKDSPASFGVESSLDASSAGSSSASWSVRRLGSSTMVEEIKQELLAKYTERGVSAAQAEQEIEVFLSDSERSEKYLEMKATAQAKADDLGLGNVVELIVGFLTGFIGLAILKSFESYRDLFPEGSEEAMIPLGM